MLRPVGSWNLLIVLAGAVACGGETAPADAAPGTTAPTLAAESLPAPSILAQARASIRDGRVAPELVDALADSAEPGAARASRLLAAFDAAEPAPRAPSSDPVVTPTVPSADPDAAVEPEATPISPAVTPTPKADPVPRREVERLRFVKKDRGAQLVIDASASVTVGIVHQHEQGIVRLVVEKSSAAAAALSSLPTTKGARVTGVRKGPGTVQITLALEPGWTIGTVSSSGRGAKVDLRPPP